MTFTMLDLNTLPPWVQLDLPLKQKTAYYLSCSSQLMVKHHHMLKPYLLVDKQKLWMIITWVQVYKRVLYSAVWE